MTFAIGALAGYVVGASTVLAIFYLFIRSIK